MDLTLLQCQYLLTSAVFLVAVITDLKTERIPNWLFLASLSCGVIVQTLFEGWSGLLTSLLGALVAGGVLIVLYAKRVLGAGDVKLMIGIGAILGPYMVFWNLCFGIIAGGITTLSFAFFQVGWHGVLASLKRYYQCLITRTYFKPSPDEAAGLKVPYAPALAIGWLVIMLAPLTLPGL
ncbi:prepilin peptidase [Ferrimonas sediminicola]|uniref:Prepilin peptidase n=1 Tax=Ferrimonas sediminicola TaxID=2569538 RepID=A0A4U1BG87_9GAMM|nr:A24 family peptidase [Ferrimonas sediminicola]TKB49970.1 prepilin peptidase [Ferrimonas sediminicola]